MPARVLVLGGTGEARAIAASLAVRADVSTILSLAGRTAAPVPQPVPTRHGGFGGAAGLAAYLASDEIDLLVDATHPFASRMSANAVAAAAQVGIPLLVLRRPAWTPHADDHWQIVATMRAAALALGNTPKRVFLAVGRSEIAVFEAAPQHVYLLRSVDPVDPAPALPHLTQLLSRGPFAEHDEADLLRREKIEVVVSKNSGGAATIGKIVAARRLGLPVVMVARPPDPPAWAGLGPADKVADLLARLDHALRTLVPRGV